MGNAYLFDLDAYNKARRQKRYVVRQTRLSRHPGIEQALLRLKRTIDQLPRERPDKPVVRRPR